MKIKVWDVPTRLFHWLLVSAIAVVYLTSRNEWFLEYHTIAGYIALGLVIFRVLWGFAGNRYARFSEFLCGWGAVRSYLSATIRLKPGRFIGHNPAVGWVVVSMLLMILTLVVTGAITYGGEENMGVWAGFFTFESAVVSKQVHTFLADAAIAVIVVHILAALFHDFILKENIILSMITGSKEDAESWRERVAQMKPGEGLSAPALGVWVVVALLEGLGLIYLPPEGKAEYFKEQAKVLDPKGFVVELKPNRTWKAECATSCHNGFHPTLLPAASWEKLFSGLDDHFGDNVVLDDNTRKEILNYLISSSASRSTTEASKKLLYSIKNSAPPVRITEIPYWKEKHSDITADVFSRKSIVSKSNCTACHPGAEAGSFEDKDISIPK